jgi:hypothetical protein
VPNNTQEDTLPKIIQTLLHAVWSYSREGSRTCEFPYESILIVAYQTRKMIDS